MRLVARLLQDPQRWRTTRQSQRFRSSYHEDLFLSFGKADQRQCTEIQGLERRMRGAQLSLSAVDDDEIRNRLSLVEASAEIARDNLTHRCEVINSRDAAHLELAIFGAVRPAILEPDTRRDGVRPLCVRDVEADESPRHPL